MKKVILGILVLSVFGLTNVRASGGKKEPNPARHSSTAVTRNILSDRLPARLLAPIKKTYKDYWITGLSQTTSNGKNSYCITVENADKKIIMNATASKNWSVTSVVAKDAAL